MSLNILVDGSIHCRTISFANEGGGTSTDTEVRIEVPTGLEYETSNLSHGTFDPTTNVWNVGVVFPGQQVTGEFCFEILDGNQGPFTIKYDIDTDSCPSSCNETSGCMIIDGITCSAFASCIPAAPAETPTTLNNLQLNGTVLTVSYTGEDLLVQEQTVDLGSLLDNTDTRVEFIQVLPNGDWEFNVLDVVGGTVVSTFTIPAGVHVTASSPTGSVSVVLNGDDYELEVTHTTNPDGSITLNDSTVIPAPVTPTPSTFTQDVTTGIITHVAGGVTTTANTVSTDTDNLVVVGTDGGSYLNCAGIKETITPSPSILEVDGVNTFTIPAPIEGTIDQGSIQLFANGSLQYPGLSEYGFTSAINGDGSTTLTTTETWGDTNDLDKIAIYYTITKTLC